MASLGLGWVGEPVVATLLEPMFHAIGVTGNAVHTTSFILGFLIFSSLHIIIGEQVPKTFAIRKSQPVSLWSAYPLHCFYLMAFPLNWLLNKASRSILALFNVEEATHGDIFSNDEIRGIINTSEQHGELNTDRATMLQNMFMFDSHTVQQIMMSRTDVETLDLKSSWTEMLGVIQDSRHSRFPVFDGDPDNPVGVVLAKDIYNSIVGRDDEADPITLVKKCLRKPLLVPESQQVSKLFETMRKDRVHLAIIMDEYGSFTGLVTMEDMLEEIVGEIADESDFDEPDSAALWVDDHWESDGKVSLSDLMKITGREFIYNPEANTINGLFMKQLERMPKKGDEFEFEGLRFVAMEEGRNRLGQVNVSLSTDQQDCSDSNADEIKSQDSD